MLKTRKSLAFVLALIMILTLIPASAFASSTNTVKDEPFTVTDDEGIPPVVVNMKLGDLGMDASEQRIRVDLTNGEWYLPNADADETNVVTTTGVSLPVSDNAAMLISPVAAAGGTTIQITPSAIHAAGDTYVEFSFLPSAAMVKDDSIKLTMNLWSGEDAGPVKVKVTSLAGQLTTSEMTVAVVTGGNSVTTVKDDPVNMTRETKEAATIQIREVAVNSIRGMQKLEFRLPSGVTWDTAKYGVNAAHAVSDPYGGDMVSGPAISAINVIGLSNSDKTLTIEFDAGTKINASEIFTFRPYISIGKDAKKGDIAVQIKQVNSGDNTIDNVSDLIVAKYGDEDVTITTVKEADIPQIISGREFETGTSEYEVEVTLEENMANSLINGRIVDFEFPQWVQVVSGQSIEVKVNSTTSNLPDSFSAVDDNSTFEWTVPADGVGGWKTSDTNKVKFTIPVTAEANKTGDMELTIVGSKAGVSEQKIVVGKAIAPVEAVLTLSDIKAGVQRQAVNDITLKETVAGAIRDESGNNKIVLGIDNANAANMGFYKGDKFKAEAVSGDLKIKNADITGGLITLTIDSTSLKTPAEIKLSGLEVSSDRTPAEGKYDLKVRGDAIIDNEWYLNNVGGNTGINAKGDFADEVVKTPYINVVTPADQGVNAAFVIGSKDYTTNGVKKTMDTAPYIDGSGRTMMPVRFVADAMGITEDQITWTQASQTSTIFGKNTVAIKVGSSTITSNGTPIAMDTVAVNNNGRVFVPVRFVANALGASVGWDQATKTVTVYNVK